jgi:hypothetical protein
MFGEYLRGVIRRRPEQDCFRFSHFGGLCQHLQRRRGNFVVADFSVYPNRICHLDYLDFSEEVGDLLAALAFVGHGFASLALRRPADGQNFFARAFFTDLFGR